MHSQIFISLPVKDVKRAVEFYQKLGYNLDPRFGENAGCLILGENLYAMLAPEKSLSTLTHKTIADAHEATTALISLSCSSKAQVDELVAKAVAAGGKTSRPPDDEGFMYSHDFEDLDGNGWGLFFMAGAPPANP